MRIAQIAPLWESVPPKTYGGTELVVYHLTEMLAREGHEVVLYATGDSRVSNHKNMRLIPTAKKALRALNTPLDIAPMVEFRIVEQIIAASKEFDIIHNHMGYQVLPFASFSEAPIVTTLHGAFIPSVLKETFEYYAHLPYVSISDYQRKPCPQLNYVQTVYHGLELSEFNPCYRENNPQPSQSYLAFLGRISPEKGVHHAIQIARETGWKLIMAAKVDQKDEEYFHTEIEPEIDGKQIVYIGEVNHAQKVELLRNAAATLCPVTWPEPFGLVLIESMACGTPVLALRNGSIPEIVKHGVTGFIADSPENLMSFVPGIGQLDRRKCRQHVEQHFCRERMTKDYIQVYESLISKTGLTANNVEVFPTVSSSFPIATHVASVNAARHGTSASQNKKKNTNQPFLI